MRGLPRTSGCSIGGSCKYCFSLLKVTWQSCWKICWPKFKREAN